MSAALFLFDSRMSQWYCSRLDLEPIHAPIQQNSMAVFYAMKFPGLTTHFHLISISIRFLFVISMTPC